MVFAPPYFSIVLFGLCVLEEEVEAESESVEELSEVQDESSETSSCALECLFVYRRVAFGWM